MNSSTFLLMYVYEYIIHTLNYKNFKNSNSCLYTDLPNPSSYLTPLSSNSRSHPLSLVSFWGLTQLLPSLTFSILIPHGIFTLKFPVFHNLPIQVRRHQGRSCTCLHIYMQFNLLLLSNVAQLRQINNYPPSSFLSK